MITPKQAADTLQVSTSTLRRWASDFEPFLDPRRGKKRLYSVGDLAVFQRIKELYANGLTTDQVKHALPVVEKPSPGDHALITITDFARALESTQANYAQLQERLDQQALLIDELRAEITAFKQPWFKRLFKKE